MAVNENLELEAEPLHCPNCDYNLTGLTRNICPECGREFDPEALKKTQSGLPKPIGKREVITRVCWPMLTGLLCSLSAVRSASTGALAVLVMLSIFVALSVPVIWIFTALACAERLTMNHVVRKRLPRLSWRRHWGVYFFSTGLILFVEFVGTAVVGIISTMVAMWLRDQMTS